MEEKIREIIINHKIIFLILFASGILLAIFLLFILTTPQKNISSPTSSKRLPAPTNITNSSPSIPAQHAWKTGENEQYAISFPENWSPATAPLSYGGTAVTIKPTDVPTTQLLPEIHIQVSSIAATPPLATRLATLSPLGLKMQRDTFNNIPSTTLFGTMPFEPVDPHDKKIYKKYIFFDSNGYSYAMSYSYFEDDHQKENEEIIKSILATLVLK